MAGQTVELQLLTKVRIRPGGVATVRVLRMRSDAVARNRRKLREVKAIAVYFCFGREAEVWVGFIERKGKLRDTVKSGRSISNGPDCIFFIF